MRIKLSYKLFFVIFIAMVVTFIFCFIVVDRLLLERYELAYRDRLDDLIEGLGEQLETMRLPEVDDLINHFAFENHANIEVTSEINDSFLFEQFTTFEDFPVEFELIDHEGLVVEEGMIADETSVIWELLDDDAFWGEESYGTFSVVNARYFIFDLRTFTMIALANTLEELAVLVEKNEAFLNQLGGIVYLTINDEGEVMAVTESFEDLVMFRHLQDFELLDARRRFDHLFLFGIDDAKVITETFEFTNYQANVRHLVTIEMSFAPATHVINQLREMVVPLLFFVVAVSILIAFFFAYYLSRPIVRISQMSRKISELDLTQRNKIKRRDEIGELAYHLNDMADKLATSMTSLTDVNEKLKVEMEKEKEREKQRKNFFMAVSHELKTPLMILKTQLSGMIEKIGAYKDRDLYLNRAHETTDSMSDLVDKLLKISQLNAAEMKLDLEVYNVSKLVTDVCKDYEDLASDKGISLTHFCDESLMATFDKYQLHTAISNIVTNAIVHTNRGEVVDIQLRRERDIGVLKIENYGAKLSDDDIKHLFEPFYRADKSRNRYTGGSGMGLYLIKSILDLHGFSYKLKNSEHGVIFVVNILLVSK